jgi:predicted DNA-binding protein
MKDAQHNSSSGQPLRLSALNIRYRLLASNLNSKTATKLVREWIDLRLNELEEDWELARDGKPVKKIAPLE